MFRALVIVALAVRVAVMVLDGDVLDSIAGALNSVISIPGDAIRAVYNAVKSVWDFFGHLTQLVGAAWDWMVNGVEWLGDRAGWLGSSVWGLGKWLIERWVPMAAHWALGQAAALAYGLAKSVENIARGLVSAAVRFLRGLVHTLETWARDAVRFLLGEIGKIGSWIARAGKYVFGLVAHPARLVDWILPALLTPLLKFLIGSSAPVIRWLIGAFVKLAPELASTLEKAVADLL